MTRQVLTGGRHLALASTAGTAAGLLTWSTLAAVGLSAIVLRNPAAFTTLQLGGGIVLVWLGIRTMVRKASSPSTAAADAAHSGSLLGSFALGYVTNLGNPKAGVFAVALLPQFIPAGADTFWASTGLGLVWALVTATWYVLFTWLVARGQAVLSTPTARRRLDLVSGGTLVAVGLTVAAGL